MSDIKVGDRVYVRTQPHNQWALLRGEIAFVVEITDDGKWVNIETRGPDGNVTGMGSVPPECLTNIMPIDSDSKAGDYVDVDGQICKVLCSFPVLWHSWECDYTGWVVEHESMHRLVMTNHGRAHFAKREDLIDRANYYKAVLIQTADALRLIDPE